MNEPAATTANRAPAPVSIRRIDPLASATFDDVATQIADAADLGFDTILIGGPFATDPSRDAASEHDPLLIAPDGGPSMPALARLAGEARRHGLAMCLELRLDQVAPGAALVRRHPGWFTYTADGLAFRFGADGVPDAWWNDLVLRLQEHGLDGLCLLGAHRMPVAAAARLNRDARARNPGWTAIAAPFGAAPPQIAGLVGGEFDHIAASSCWWDGEAAWLADDLERIACAGNVASFAVPPLAASQTVADWRLAVAGFLGTAWVMNAAIPPRQRAAVTALNSLRRTEREVFAGRPFSLAPPHAATSLFARFAADGRGLALACTPTGAEPDRHELHAFLAGRAAAPVPVPLEGWNAAGLAWFTTSPLPAHHSPESPRHSVDAPRIAIEAIAPAVDGGRFPVKRMVGEDVTVEADLLCDGHGRLAADLLWRMSGEPAWRRAPMAAIGNDRWRAQFGLSAIGRAEFTIEAWVDRYGTFADELAKKHEAGLDVRLELVEGRQLLDAAIARAGEEARTILAECRAGLERSAPGEQVGKLTAPAIIAAMRDAEERRFLERHEPALPIDSERRAAGFASWYEIFPRSQSGDADRHGTFDDVIAALPRIRAMGFDVLYFPPIHPIGRKNRKGPNNTLVANPGDPGSPYAIGSAEGGHDAIHPELGSFDDFRRLISAAAGQGLEIALDFAIQCAPDHPWLAEHPEWFDWRPDGSIKYAENPPKKYQDIVNVDFYADGARPALWHALRDIVLFWIREGIRIFRVDNPHTKPFPFWEWLIADIRRNHPDVIFLSEAFTRPKIMHRLAKIGFSQSYTYFTWRNSADEMKNYLVELTQSSTRDYFRPHFFVNTPDINPAFLQTCGRPGFLIRAALAATLSGLWGVYNGFELCEAAAPPGTEEYLDSEKYQIRSWDYGRSGNIVAEISLLNRIRRQNPALQSHLGVHFIDCDNDNVLCFEKASPDRSNIVLVAISFDPRQWQTTRIDLPLERYGSSGRDALHLEDLMRGVAFTWHGRQQVVDFDPGELPFSIWRIRK